MIQRKQTIFLLIAAILAVVCIVVRITDSFQWADLVQCTTAGLAIGTIFLYKKRMIQARYCLVAILLVFVWYIIVAVTQQQLTTIDCLPMVEAIFFFLARKSIIADEKLVRAADRLR